MHRRARRQLAGKPHVAHGRAVRRDPAGGVPAEAYDELVDALQALSAQGIRVLIAESGIEQSCTWKPIAMELVGNDRPGIVRDITRLLSEQGVNLERLVTEVRRRR
jgi:glycine cleavage system regulatory protein